MRHSTIALICSLFLVCSPPSSKADDSATLTVERHSVICDTVTQIGALLAAKAVSIEYGEEAFRVLGSLKNPAGFPVCGLTPQTEDFTIVSQSPSTKRVHGIDVPLDCKLAQVQRVRDKQVFFTALCEPLNERQS